MAKIIQEPSRTFGEYLLIPNLTTKDCIVANVDLKTPLVRFKKGNGNFIEYSNDFCNYAVCI